MKKLQLFWICFVACLLSGLSETRAQDAAPPSSIMPGAERVAVYLPYLKDKRVAVFANQTSRIGTQHLVDSLLRLQVHIVKLFSPEHGFRGKAAAGEKVANQTDALTGLPIISLYGKHLKPTPEDLADVDLILFDVQDVGVRFYTYISSLQYILEAALELHKPLLILDRPNPNGFYVDGPVLDSNSRSFVGLQPVPLVYGMTLGEYALMLAGENWLSPEANRNNAYNIQTEPTADTPFHIQVIKCKFYDHNSYYALPVAPSPNLAKQSAIYWYPSTALFEGTVLSEGRGTDLPFQVFGHPQLPDTLFAFTPQPNEAAPKSKWYHQRCYGWNVSGEADHIRRNLNGKINLSYLLEAYRLFPQKDSFFLANGFFQKLAGAELQKQIKAGLSEAAIRDSWKPALRAFQAIRKKYLLYPDFNDDTY